jgi:alkylation response protein AidB-like acyl-CoA dehydrogenase
MAATVNAPTPATDAETRVVELTERLLSTHPPASTPAAEFLGAQFDLGLAWVHFPEGDGGLGLPPKLQGPVGARLRAAKAPSAGLLNPIGFGMGAPTVATHGTVLQRRRYLRPLFTGEEVWCQLFSEPGAGSDVAGLATRAVRDGDEWVVNGQKVWTTLAHLARWGMLVARTDPEAPKHRGLTYFVIDMHAAGVDVRPLRQMTGEAEFNEVYFTDVRIPDRERLGAAGDGWHVALTTLMNERVSIGGGISPRGSGPIADALQLWTRHHAGNPSPGSAVLKDRLVRLWIRSEANRLTNLRASENRKQGTPGPEGSTGKLAMAELNKDIYNLCVDLMGLEGSLYGSYEMVRPALVGGYNSPDIRKSFLRARANSIEGGTSEVMRNILGERVLGLPGEPRVDKDRPWSQIPRS